MYASFIFAVILLSFRNTIDQNPVSNDRGSVILNRQMPSFFNWLAMKNLQYVCLNLQEKYCTIHMLIL